MKFNDSVMKNHKRRKYLIQYTLFLCVLLIQSIIFLFFYNEFFNGKKIQELEQQIVEINELRTVLDTSKEDIVAAQENLQDYIDSRENDYLEAYFASLQSLHQRLDSITNNKAGDLVLKDVLSNKHPESIADLKETIDSTYRISKERLPQSETFHLESFEISDTVTKVAVNIDTKVDSLPRKKLVPRLIAALRNKVDVQKELTVITTSYTDSIDKDAIRRKIDSLVEAVHSYYEKEFVKYQKTSVVTNNQIQQEYIVYNQLIALSNQWMDVYNTAINSVSQQLMQQFSEQNSENNKFRRNLIFGLMFLMFIVIAIMIHYTRQAQRYERELRAANILISKNLKFKNRVLGMLSHEVRSPLKIINLFIDRIRKRNQDTQIENHLSSIKFTNDSLLIQANQILEYAKNEEQEMQINATEVNLKTEIDAVFEIFQPFIEYKNNAFIAENLISDDLKVLIDIAKIHQLFTNLLGNANKYTENGTVSVKVKTDSNEGKECLQVLISDTGIGMSTEDVKNIFEPFYQVGASQGKENVGVGLGLNLCKEIIDKLGGEIAVESEPNKGTTVIFKINLVLAQ